MKLKIGLVKGDGIGPEIVECAVNVLNKALYNSGYFAEYEDLCAGGVAIDKYGVPLPDDTVKNALECDSILLGAVGGPKWDNLPGHLRPERALLGLRKELELFANIRPVRMYEALKDRCLLKDADKIDIVIVRELTGGIYFGKRGRNQTEYGIEAFDTETYNEMEIERIGRVAFEYAMKRRRKVTSIDKANVLESSRLWREVMHNLSMQFPLVEYNDMLVDNAAMQLIRNPKQFDVIVASNMFGDILSDEASQLTGSIGMLPSASLGIAKRGLYEPIHGSAPDIAGKNLANPIATILSVSMMLSYSFKLDDVAEKIDFAVEKTLNNRYLTKDIGGDLTTNEITERILNYL
ncbi:MAG TPA: 3-isopropylmalate dehydrogenase [Clostridia bacterium]|jgi:3-isopropylmalate dehydrogenase|nr:MAG: 3-isopropylmalate dehydrogenase [Firmicutes bacterium ADurb.Bin146]HOD93658.1 3-isopropylmalate dehydrogenase [Clostridia bacterium]HQM39894.1 3-isopropylmalate dehydrogenase [Clostridia bacterium]